MHGLKEPLAQVDHARARLADSTLGASFLLTHDRGRSKPSLRPRATPDEKETPPKAHCGAETHARISDRILSSSRLSASRPLRTTVKYENHRSPERVCLHTGSELVPSRPCFAMRSCGAPSGVHVPAAPEDFVPFAARALGSRGAAGASTRRAHTHNTQQSQRQQRGEIVRANSAEHR
jgi:hypothetical protein